MVKNAIINLGQSIISGFQSILEFLFVPSDNLFDDVKQLFEQRFAFVYQAVDLLNSISFVDDDDMPTFNIVLYGKKLNIIDFSIYATYRTYIHNIILVIAYYNFIRWFVNNAPAIITGTGSALSSKGGE